jgi:hypothetical protein
VYTMRHSAWHVITGVWNLTLECLGRRMTGTEASEATDSSSLLL